MVLAAAQPQQTQRGPVRLGALLAVLPVRLAPAARRAVVLAAQTQRVASSVVVGAVAMEHRQRQQLAAPEGQAVNPVAVVVEVVDQ